MQRILSVLYNILLASLARCRSRCKRSRSAIQCTASSLAQRESKFMHTSFCCASDAHLYQHSRGTGCAWTAPFRGIALRGIVDAPAPDTQRDEARIVDSNVLDDPSLRAQ